MADFEQKMLMLAERGTPIGAEAMIERVERELAGLPMVAAERRSRRFTVDIPPKRGLALAIAAFVAVLAIGAFLYIVSQSGPPEFTEPEPPPTTVVTIPPPTTADAAPTSTSGPPQLATPAADVSFFEEAATAWFGNDVDAVIERFLIPAGRGAHQGWTAEQVSDQMEYEAAIGTRINDLTCELPGSAGQIFQCTYAYSNAVTDALGSPETREISIRVEDGRVTWYDFSDLYNGFPSGNYTRSIASYLAFRGEYAPYEHCVEDGLDASCAEIQLEHLDDWLAFNGGGPLPFVESFVDAWFSGKCDVVMVVFDDDACADIEFETAITAQVEVADCDIAPAEELVQCDVTYSNVLHEAVGAAPVVLRVAFTIFTEDPYYQEVGWATAAYPEDAALLESFKAWADSTGLGDEWDDQCTRVAPYRSPACADFMLENLDAWAAWYQANN